MLLTTQTIRKTGGILLILFLSFPADSQLIDSLEYYFSKKPKLDIRLDSRNAFITNRQVQIFGIKAGVNHSRSVKYGLGYNQLITTLDREFHVQDELQDYTYRMHYLAPYFEYSFFVKKRWEISIPIQLGFGTTYYRPENSALPRLDQNLLVIYEPMMSAEYHFFRYFTAGLAVGYRIALVGGRSSPESITSPTYALRFNFLIGKLYRDIFPKKE